MNPVIPSDNFNTLFASLPLIIGIAIVIVAYVALRDPRAKEIPSGKRISCTKCGRRAQREHMVPATHAGAMGWYCSQCTTN